MKNIIGNDGCFSGADEILMGTFKPHPNLFHSKQSTSITCNGKKIRPTDARETINMQDIKDDYKRWKEKTSTSRPNRHLGHYKSLLAADGISKKDQNNATSDTIRKFIITLIIASITLSPLLTI